MTQEQDLKINFKNLPPYYQTPTMLRHGNVFSRVCPSVILSMGMSHVTITRDALDLTIQEPYPQS